MTVSLWMKRVIFIRYRKMMELSRIAIILLFQEPDMIILKIRAVVVKLESFMHRDAANVDWLCAVT